MRGTGRIGVISPFFTAPSFVQRLRGIAEALSAKKFELVIYTVDSAEHLKSFLSSRAANRQSGWPDHSFTAG